MPMIHIYSHQLAFDPWKAIVEEFFLSQTSLRENVKIIAPPLYTAFQFFEETKQYARKFYIDDILARLGLELPKGVNEKLYYTSGLLAVNDNHEHSKVNKVVHLMQEFYRGKIPGFNLSFTADRDMHTTLRLVPIPPCTYGDIANKADAFKNALNILNDSYLEMIAYVKGNL